MLPETFQHLSDHGFVRDERVWTGRIIDRLRDLLTAQPVTVEAEIQEKAQTIAELRAAVLGESDVEGVDEELDDRVRNLVASSPSGRVQTALENGYVLCSAPVMRAGETGELTEKQRARFVTSDPDLVEAYFQVPLIKRAVSSATTVNRGLELSARRVPALATKRWALAQKTHEEIAYQIPLKAQS